MGIWLSCAPTNVADAAAAVALVDEATKDVAEVVSNSVVTHVATLGTHETTVDTGTQHAITVGKTGILIMHADKTTVDHPREDARTYNNALIVNNSTARMTITQARRANGCLTTNKQTARCVNRFSKIGHSRKHTLE